MTNAEDTRSSVLRFSQKFYGRRAFYYDLFAQRQRRDPQTDRQVRFLEQVFKRASRPVNRVLDVACGGGRHVVALAQRGYDCTGYDFTPARIEAAKARAIRAAVSIELKRGDATRLRTRDRFDGVLALYILFLLPNDDDVKRCLSSIHSLLFPGGVLICSIYNPFSSAKNWVTETTRQGVFVEESKAPGIRTVTITRLRQFDRMRGVCWMNETEIIDAPDGVHLFHDQERVRLFTYSEILNLLRTTGFREITAHLDWKRKPVENSKAEEIVFVARK